MPEELKPSIDVDPSKNILNVLDPLDVNEGSPMIPSLKIPEVNSVNYSHTRSAAKIIARGVMRGDFKGARYFYQNNANLVNRGVEEYLPGLTPKIVKKLVPTLLDFVFRK